MMQKMHEKIVGNTQNPVVRQCAACNVEAHATCGARKRRTTAEKCTTCMGAAQKHTRMRAAEKCCVATICIGITKNQF